MGYFISERERKRESERKNFTESSCSLHKMSFAFRTSMQIFFLILTTN